MAHWIAAHQVQAALWAYIIFGAMVDAMPSPTPQSSPFYLWAFKVTHTLMLRVKTAYTASNADRRQPPSAT